VRKAPQAVVDALNARIAALLTDDDLWDYDLGDDYTAAEIARLMADFRDNPPSAVKGYPRHDAKFPRWCVVLYGGSADQEFLAGGRTGRFTNETVPREVVQAYLSNRVGIEVYVENSQEVCELHSLLAFKAILAAVGTFQETGIEGRSIGGIEDMHPIQRGLPDAVFIRAQAWEMSAMEATVATAESGWMSGPARVALSDMELDDDGNLGRVQPVAQSEL
jgi:hypothetical protein